MGQRYIQVTMCKVNLCLVRPSTRSIGTHQITCYISPQNEDPEDIATVIQIALVQEKPNNTVDKKKNDELQSLMCIPIFRSIKY